MGLNDLANNKISGSYECHNCRNTVIGATQDRENGKLFWICPECKYRSEIKWIGL